MFGLFPQSPHMPCTECGASVERAAADAHVCDAERMLDFRLFQLRDEIAAFDAQYAAPSTNAFFPARLLMLMIQPPPRARRCGIAARQQ